MAAAHLPEMYEEATLGDVLERMRERFQHSFDFDFEIKEGEEGEEVEITFHPCGLNAIVTEQGQELGKAVLCQLFHEYWSGLLGAFTQKRFRCSMKEVGATCAMHLSQ
jgi:hypothetical protein